MTKDSIMREKVVIIIPTYNEALNIEQTITNLLKESIYIMDFLVEILVFDSASTDHTAEIVKNLAKTNKRVRVSQIPIQHQSLLAFSNALRGPVSNDLD